MVNGIPSHLKSHLTEVLAAVRGKAMTLLASELVTALNEASFTLDEFVNGLADYLATQTEWQSVTPHLEAVVEELARSRRETGGSEK